MAEDPYHSEKPPDEAWWERELHRNEKLMDKYMAVLGENPDWDKWKNPEDLLSQARADLDPAGEESRGESTSPGPDGDLPRTSEDEEFLQELNEGGEAILDDPNWEDPDEDPEVNANFEAVEARARDYASRVFDLEKLPQNAELLYLSAGKVGANLAGGHGLGYDDDSICGNIVKCRWALSDCEFCREMLEQLHQKTGDARYAELIEESRQLAEVIRERIARLRARVWW